MFLSWTKIGEKSFMKEHVWKTFITKNDQEIIGTTTKNKDMCTNLTKKSMNKTPFWESFKGK